MSESTAVDVTKPCIAPLVQASVVKACRVPFLMSESTSCLVSLYKGTMCFSISVKRVTVTYLRSMVFSLALNPAPSMMDRGHSSFTTKTAI